MSSAASPSSVHDPRWALVVDNLHKSFPQPSGEPLHALRGLSFAVAKGSIVSLLGPNGAGKTTAMRILATLSHPSQGRVFLNGIDALAYPLQARQQLGVVFQNNHFNRYLNVWHNLILHAHMHGLQGKAADDRITELLNQVGLFHRRDALMEQLSGGQQRRIALIRSLVHRPKILYLDEPTTGLDPQARQELWQQILELKNDDTTVLMTTHYMDEADQLSDTIIMMSHGQKVLEGTPDAIKRTLGQENLFELLFVDPYAAHFASQWQNDASITQSQVLNPTTLQVVLNDPSALKHLVQQVEPDQLVRVGRVQPSLEAVFLTMAALPANDPRLLALKQPLPTDDASLPAVSPEAAFAAPAPPPQAMLGFRIHWRWGIFPLVIKILRAEAQGLTMEIITTLVFPLTFFLAFGLGLRGYLGEVDGMTYPVFLVPGLIAYVIMLGSFSIGAWAMWLDRWHTGMLDEARIKPITMTDIVLGQLLGSFVTSVIKGMLVAAFLWLITEVKFNWLHWPLFLAAVMPASLVFTCLGTAAGTLLRKPDNIAQTLTIVVTPLLYLGGLFFPISVFPAWVQPVVKWLPTTLLFEASRSALLHGVADPWALLALWSYAITTLVVTVRAFRQKLAE
jgi:ABC-type multidrug transport system ATPase subunit/ABC-type multidrug transport system permease subunit